MNDYLIEIQSGERFDVSKDVLIRLNNVNEDYVEGYVDALQMQFSHRFIHCNKVPVKISDSYKKHILK